MSVAEKLNPDEAAVFAGHVERADGPTLLVRSLGSLLHARRAPSCLLEPEKGDRVLCASTGEGSAYVLAILDREVGAPQRWVADGDVTIESKTGRVDLIGRVGASIASLGEIALQGRALDVRSRIAKLSIGKLALLGEEVIAEVTRTKLVASTIDSVAELVTQTASRAFRVVTEMDHVRAGSIDMAAEKALVIHAENAMVTAKDLVKMDGEAVQLG